MSNSFGRVTLVARAAWPAISRGATVLVPTGSTEQHGPHLPFETDSVIAGAVAAAAAEHLAAVRLASERSGAVRSDSERVGHVLVAPTVTYGASGEHQAFAGTMSIGQDALRMLLVELVRSLSTWAGRVVFVNGHGGNVASLASAVRQLRDEGHNAAWVPCAGRPGAASERAADRRTTDARTTDARTTDARTADYPRDYAPDAHAGRTETSLMLHLAPADVALDRLEPGNTEPLSLLMRDLSEGGVAAVSPNGILGDPRGATAAEGEALFEQIVDTVVRRIGADRPNEHGLLQ
ncbi:MAG: mftE [Subtercola sp.]|nr:mftE [Subtercola sp.]